MILVGRDVKSFSARSCVYLFFSFFFYVCIFWIRSHPRKRATKNHLEDKIRTVTQPLYKLHTNYRFLCLIWYTNMYNFFLSCASRYNKLWGEKTERRVVSFKQDNFELAWEFHYPSRLYTQFHPYNVCVLSLASILHLPQKSFSLLKIRPLS